MADEKANGSDTATSPLQQNEDIGGSTNVFSDTREIREMTNQNDNATSLDQFCSTEKVDGCLLNVGVHSSMIQHTTEFSGPAQNIPGWTLTMNNHSVSGFGGIMDAGFGMINSNTGFPGQQFPTYQNIPVQTAEGRLFRGSEGHQLADQVTSGSRGSGRGRGRGRGKRREPSLKRPATPSPSKSARAAQRTNIIHPSASASAQVAPSVAFPTEIAPLPTQTQTTASLPSLPQNVDYHQVLSRPLGVPFPVLTVDPPQAHTAAFHPSVPQNADYNQTMFWPLGVPFSVQTVDPPWAHTAAFHPSVPQNADYHQTLFWPLGVPFPVQNADPPQAQTAAFCPSIPQTVGLLQHLSDTPTFALSDSETPLRISPGLDKAQPQRQSMCFICRKYLSSTAERLTTTLPCGHSFHTECLLCITSADQYDNPPCMACIWGESTN